MSRAEARHHLPTLLQQQNNRCAYCGWEFSAEVPPTVEHVRRVDEGGTNRLSNLLAVCDDCNHIADMVVQHRRRLGVKHA